MKSYGQDLPSGADRYPEQTRPPGRSMSRTCRSVRATSAFRNHWARQSVVFELGYFYGKLKRENVIVLNFG